MTATRAERKARTARRRPVRRFLVITHRWMSLLLGLVLLAITTSGAILLYRPELEKLGHGDAYAASAGPATVDVVEAREIVLQAHPDFAADGVWLEHGVYRVTDYESWWTVDPATGEILGHLSGTPKWIQFLDNLHECFLACEDYPGYIAALNEPVPLTRWAGFDGEELTWGGLALAVLGLMLLYLSLTGLWLWFPRPRRFKQAVSVRWKRGRFARDTDLHNVVGLLALGLLVVWAYTGAGYATELMEKGWYAVTPGSAHPEVDAVSAKAEKGTPDITPREAADAAQARYPDLKLVNMDVPVKGDRTGAYTFYFQRGLDPWGNNDYPGNVGVFVDRHTGETGDFYGFADEPVAQRIWEDWNYPTHSGYVVNGWWRIIWLLAGLAPLVLAWTGVSTWLVRRRTRRARRKAAKAGAVPPPVPDTVAEVLADDPEQDPELATVLTSPGDDSRPS